MRVNVWIRREGARPSEPAILTASSYGLPVVVLKGETLAAAEVGGVLVIEDPIAAGRAEAADYVVAPSGGAR